ncbi:MAG: CapA family protein [bacterium]
MAPSVSFLCGGDIALNRAAPPAGRPPLGRLAPLFQKSDLAFANLEVPLSRRGRPAPEKIILRGPPEMARELAAAGFDALSFANNHALDYGEEAFFDTLGLLAEAGVDAVGAGRSLAAARRAVLLRRRGLTVGVLAFSSVLPRGFAAGKSAARGRSSAAGVNPLRARTAYRPARDLDEYPGTPPEIRTWAVAEDLRRMKRDVRKLRKAADLVIVNHHWGTSMVHETGAFQREIARAAVGAGADLVLGGHPHVIQGVEFHKGRPIVYSMGNLIFDFDIPFFTPATRQTFLFGCTLSKKGVEDAYLLPCRCGVNAPPTLLSPRRGEGREIGALLARLNAPFGARLAPEGDRIRLLPPGE